MEFNERSRVQIDLPFRPFRDDLVHIHVLVNFTAYNPNPYDLYFSDTEIQVSGGQSSDPAVGSSELHQMTHHQSTDDLPW